MKFLKLYNILLQNRLDDYKLQLKDEQLANNIFSLNDPKKERMIVKWIKNGSIQFPKDINKVNDAYQIINRKQLDYNKFNSPQQIINQYSDLNNKLNYNPDKEPAFTNKVELGNGVVVYDVQDTDQGRDAVRKAVDMNWGKQSNPWCIIARNDNGRWRGDFWDQYNKIPKRICFKNGELIAMCASDNILIKWWDREDNLKPFKKITGVDDDLKAIEFVKKTQSPKDKALDPNTTIQQMNNLYQNYKDDEIIIKYLINNPNCPIELLQKIGQNIQYLLYIFENPKFKQSKKLMNLYQEYYLAGKDKNTNPQKLRQIYQKFKYNINFIKYVASNPNTPQDILRKMGLSNFFDTLAQVVILNPSTSPQLLKQIYQKYKNLPYLGIYINLAKNPKTPIQVIKKLLNKRINMVDEGLAINTKNPQILTILSKSNNYYILQLIARNSKCPIQILTNLIRKYILQNQHFQIIYNVINNPNCTKELLQQIYNLTKYNGIMYQLAGNKKTPMSILRKLAKNKEFTVSDRAKETINDIKMS